MAPISRRHGLALLAVLAVVVAWLLHHRDDRRSAPPLPGPHGTRATTPAEEPMHAPTQAPAVARSTALATAEPLVPVAPQPEGDLDVVVVRLVDDQGCGLRAEAVVLVQATLEWHRAATDTSGVARLDGVEPGRYNVRVEGLQPGWAPPEKPPSVRKRAGTPASIDIVLTSTGFAEVAVVGPTGAPVVGARVSLLPGGRGVAAAAVSDGQSDGAGRIAFGPLPPGLYFPRLELPWTHPLRTATRPLPVPIDVRSGQLATTELRFPNTGVTAEVVVVDARSGAPIPGVPVDFQVDIEVGDASRSVTVASIVSDIAGRASAPNVPLVVLRASARGVVLDTDPRAEGGLVAASALVMAPCGEVTMDMRGGAAPAAPPRMAIQLVPDVARFEIECPVVESYEQLGAPPVIFARVRHAGRTLAEHDSTAEVVLGADPDGRFRVCAAPPVAGFLVRRPTGFGPEQWTEFEVTPAPLTRAELKN